MALLGIGVLAAACGGGSSRLRPSPAWERRRPRPLAVGRRAEATRPSPVDTALAFIDCMRTHGEPNMPEPVISGNSAQHRDRPELRGGPELAAVHRCDQGMQAPVAERRRPQGEQTITPADQADYLKAAACMRSHGIPDFPDPTFQDNSVTFNTRTPIDTNSSQYKSALATCQKLIPAGLPYSSPSGS